MLKLFIVVLCFLPISLFAQGHDIGNGGDGVICYTDLSRTEIVSTEMFDYWENSHVANIPGGIQLGANELSVQEKIDIATNRLKYFDEKFASDVRTIALGMADNIQNYLVTPEQLPEINDAHPRMLPVSPCFIEQFAVQWQDLKTGARRFAISKKFYHFSGTSNNTRVGIILHEALYRLAILRGAQNSDGVRYFNYVLATNLFEGEDLASYVHHLQKANLDDKRCYLKLDPILETPVYVMGERDMYACSPIRLSFKQWRLKASRIRWTQKERLDLSLDQLFSKVGDSWSEITTFGSELGYAQVQPKRKIGFIQLFESPNANLFLTNARNKIPCDASQRLNTFELNAKEEIISCNVKGDTSYSSQQGMNFALKALSLIKLTEDKVLRELTLAHPAQMYFSGTMTLLNVNTTGPVVLDREEKLVSGLLSKPVSVMINGSKKLVSRIEGVGPNGGAMVQVIHQLGSVFQGRRTLRSAGYTGLSKAQPLCRRLGYQGSNTPEDFLRIYITQPETFYNPVTDSIEEKADEFVELLPFDIHCSGTFEAKI